MHMNSTYIALPRAGAASIRWRRTCGALVGVAALAMAIASTPVSAAAANTTGASSVSSGATASLFTPPGALPSPKEQVVPSAPCHPNPTAMLDGITVAHRGDVVNLPDPLRTRLVELAERPHSILPVQARAEANEPSQLFQYYLLDTHGFEPNVFTHIFPGVNDQVMLTVTGANCDLPTIGSVRAVLEPKPGLPTDPNNPRAFIDIFTDIDPLFVINNESGWYEGWMIHDLTVPEVAPPRADDPSHAQFGKLLQADADMLKAMGTGHNQPGALFTIDGKGVRFPSETDHFPDVQTNVVPIQL